MLVWDTATLGVARWIQAWKKPVANLFGVTIYPYYDCDIILIKVTLDDQSSWMSGRIDVLEPLFRYDTVTFHLFNHTSGSIVSNPELTLHSGC